METKALPPSTPAQKNGTNSSYEVSPVGGTQATEHVHWLKCEFHIVHAPAAIWKEKGVLTAKHPPVQYKELILELLEAIQLPAEVAIIHCKPPKR